MLKLFMVTIHSKDQEGRPTKLKALVEASDPPYAVATLAKMLPNLKVRKLVWNSPTGVDIKGKWGYDYEETFPTDVEEIMFEKGVKFL